MSPDAPKPVVALYLRYYLSPSETFVYRQLRGVRGAVHPIVLTSRTTHLELFPVEDLFAKEKGYLGKATSRFARVLRRRSTAITRAQFQFWKKILSERKARLIHAHFGHFGLDILPVARAAGLPLLVTFHGLDASALLRNTLYARDLRDLFEYASVLTVSQNMAERLSPFGLRRERARVHYIGAPVEEFAFVERTPVSSKIASGAPLTFLQVSNFVEKKGHAYTVEAFARYLRDRPQDRLVLAGDGPLRASIEERCAALGIRERVAFPGRTVQPQQLMREADVFVHHSVIASDGDMEGLPTVLMEAMATGLVVVSTRHSGIPELVENGIDGYLVEERDIDSYVSTLRSLSRLDPAMPRRAREKIERKFDMSKQNLALQRIYRELIDESRA